MIILKKTLSNKSLIIHSLVLQWLWRNMQKIDENIDEFYNWIIT